MSEYYQRIQKLSMMWRYYAYVDTPNHAADFCMRTNGVSTVHFLKEMVKDDSDYIIVFCKVSKRENAEFLAAMKSLPERMKQIGHPDYCKEAAELFSQLEEAEVMTVDDAKHIEETKENPDKTQDEAVTQPSNSCEDHETFGDSKTEENAGASNSEPIDIVSEHID